MTRRSKGGEGHRLLSEKMKSAALGLTLLLSPFVALSQTNVQTYHFSEDVKQYATELDVQDMHTVMAGTIYNPAGNTDQWMHFMRLDPIGIVDGGVSIYYDDPDFLEERVVDIVRQGNGDQYIIASVRPDPGGVSQYSTDMIKVLKVDRDGNRLEDELITGYIGTPSDYDCIYPTHSLYDPSNDMLFICGFVTRNTTIPNYPGYADDKRAVVLRIDVSSTPYTVTHARAFDYVYNPAPSSDVNDYDMALRMVWMDNGNIFVTGSTNAVIDSIHILHTQPFYHSGVMNMELDPSNLNVAGAGAHNKPFSTGFDSYGIGLFQKNDVTGPIGVQANKYNLVLSNRFTTTTVQSFNTAPMFFSVSATDRNLDYYDRTITGRRSRWEFHWYDYAWALQPVENEMLITTNGLRITIAGMQRNQNGNCLNPAPTDGNMNPFLYSARIDWSAGMFGADIQAQPITQMWTTYQNQAGTGQPPAANSYPLLGEGLANIGWHPEFAIKDPGTNGVVMSAPRYDTDITDLLHLKYIRTNDRANDFLVPDCPTSSVALHDSTTCWPPAFSADFVYDPFIPGTIALDKNITNYTANVHGGLSADVPYSYTEHDCSSNPSSPVFRTAGTQEELASEVQASIHPNPANNYIEVQVKGAIAPETMLEIKLMNMLGQEVANLYKGSAEKLNSNTQLQLPYAGSGIYMVQIWSNNKMLAQQKLSIQ